MAEILFYSSKDAYGCFSDFAKSPFLADGKVWYGQRPSTIFKLKNLRTTLITRKKFA
jgi:predicted NAD-dependent protein-ADP-ribosyltransferase YbiA (DUF1768 family)